MERDPTSRERNSGENYKNATIWHILTHKDKLSNSCLTYILPLLMICKIYQGMIHIIDVMKFIRYIKSEHLMGLAYN